MKNKIFTKIVIMLLVIQAGMISSIPLVLCFGEDGHVQLEIAKITLHGPYSDQSSNNKNRPIEMPYSNQKNNGCGDCYDIPILFKFIANNEIINLNNFLEYKYPVYSIYSAILDSIETKFFKDIIGFNQSHSTYNTILIKMSLLI